MFETYQFAGVYIAIQAVLTLYAQGKMAQEQNLRHRSERAPTKTQTLCGLLCFRPSDRCRRGLW